jgi:transposase
MSLNGRIDKVLYIYTIEYYSAIKSKDLKKFAGKCIVLEHIILSNVMQTQKGMYGMYLLIIGY